MDDQEQMIYDLMSSKVQEKYENAFISHQRIPVRQSQFPAISIILTDNRIMSDYSTFDQEQIVCQEKYQFEVASDNDFHVVKDILAIIDQQMSLLGYMRTHLGVDENQETNDIRRISEYEKLIMK